jgi:hypothetical protein
MAYQHKLSSGQAAVIYSRNAEEIATWKKELAELLPLAGSNVAIDERLLELDSLIENSVDGTSALPRKIKQDLGDTKRIQLLIEKIDKLIEGE